MIVQCLKLLHKKLYTEKDMHGKGHKILRNLPLTFDRMHCSQKLGEDFAKFCGLLRIYELYLFNFGR